MKTNVGNILAVLLADGWHDVASQSFVVDRMRLVKAGEDVYPPPEDVGEPWFGFSDGTNRMAGPMRALLAVRVTSTP